MKVAAIVILIALYVAVWHDARQRQIINDLIELNHDKSVYIDSGCRVPYQGTEEMLPGEVKVLQ